MATSARILAPAVLAAMILVPVTALAAGPPPFRVPVPVERTLANGLRVAVFPDHRLPLVQMQLIIPAGAAQEPAGTPGVATAVAQLLRAGTSSRTAEVLAADVDRMGGTLGASATRDVSTVSATFLAADLDAGLELLADAVVNSVFPQQELDRYRRQLAGYLAQAQQNPALLADARLWEAAFGSHPYARFPLGRCPRSRRWAGTRCGRSTATSTAPTGRCWPSRGTWTPTAPSPPPRIASAPGPGAPPGTTPSPCRRRRRPRASGSWTGPASRAARSASGCSARRASPPTRWPCRSRSSCWWATGRPRGWPARCSRRAWLPPTCAPPTASWARPAC